MSHLSDSWDRQLEIMYKRWLVQRVILHGETTLKCAKHISADPEEVERDLEQALNEDWAEIAAG